MGQGKIGWQDRPSGLIAIVVRLLPAAALLLPLAAWPDASPLKAAGPRVDPARHLAQHRLFRWRDANGRLQMGPENEVLSHNWSGYGLAGGGPYISVQGSWVVPTVSYEAYAGAADVEVSSTWIGIGGQDGDDTLVQIGTQQMAAPSGKTRYLAWYEILPATEVAIDPKQFPVSGGDTIGAVIQCTAGCTPNAKSTWLLTLTDSKWPKPFTVTLQYSSSLASAEWIVEGPCVKNCDSSTPSFASLPNYGKTTFSAVTVNDVIPKLQLSGNGIIMKDPNGNATSTPSDPFDGNSFTVSFAI